MVSRNTISIKMLCIALFGWYFIVFGVSAERTNIRDNIKDIPFLDKQHDYHLAFERAEAVRYDHKYVNALTVFTSKYNRTTPVCNAAVTFKVDLANEIEVITQAYRFASNEYRLFPMRFQFNFCEAVKKNTIGLGDFRKCGTFTGCPIVKGKNYTICNWTPNPSQCPPFVPNGQYMLEFQVMFRNVELLTVRGYIKIFRPILIPD